MSIGLLNIRILIQDVKALVAQAGSGNWMSDGGVLDIGSQILGIIAGGETGRMFLASRTLSIEGDPSDEEVEAVLESVRQCKQALTGRTLTAKLGSFNPDFWLGLLNLVQTVISDWQSWRKANPPAPPAPPAPAA